MAKVSYRLSRIADLIQQEIARLLLTEVNDTRVKKITVTRVKMSPDLRQAKIYFMLSPANDLPATTKILNRTTAFFQRRIANNLDLRIVPDIRFYYDQSLHDTQHLLSVLENLPRTAVQDDETAV